MWLEETHVDMALYSPMEERGVLDQIHAYRRNTFILLCSFPSPLEIYWESELGPFPLRDETGHPYGSLILVSLGYPSLLCSQW